MEFHTIFLYFFLLYIISLFTKIKYVNKNLPPGPAPWPIIGNLFQVGRDVHKSLAKLSVTYGPIMTLKFGQLTTVVISNTDLAKQVLQYNDLSFAGRTFPDTVRALSHNESSIIWLPVSPLWKSFRKICRSNIFTVKSLNLTADLRHKKVADLVGFVMECSREGKSVNIGEAMLVTSLNLMSNTVYSVDLAKLGSDKAMEFRELVTGIVEAVGMPNVANYFPVIGKVDPQGTRRRFAMFAEKLFEITDEFIRQRLESGEKMGDVLDAILEAVADENTVDGIKTSQIKNLLSDLFVAALDTTSITLEWAMAELLRNPLIMAKVREEIHQIIGKEKAIQESDIPKFSYLQAVVKETLRLHPAAPLLVPHRAEKDVRINGYTIPMHAQVLINAWAIGRDSNHWKKSEEFCPDRFLGSDIDVKGRNFELIPFGAGRRICPGLPLALRMVHLVLGSLIQRFDWKVVGGKTIVMEEDFNITLRMHQPLHAIPVSCITV